MKKEIKIENVSKRDSEECAVFTELIQTETILIQMAQQMRDKRLQLIDNLLYGSIETREELAHFMNEVHKTLSNGLAEITDKL